MDINEVHFIYFSPTRTSKQVGEAIVRGTGLTNVVTTNLTLHTAEVDIPENTLTVIAVPVYGGKVAPLAMERLQGIRASGSPVVLVAVYGNRAYEKALIELDAFAETGARTEGNTLSECYTQIAHTQTECQSTHAPQNAVNHCRQSASGPPKFNQRTSRRNGKQRT